MADRQIDPARLQGEALRRWYLRSPEDLEQERQVAAAKRHRNFFGDPGADPDPGFNQSRVVRQRDIGSDYGRSNESPADDIDEGFNRVPAGQERWRGQRAGQGQLQELNWAPNASADDGGSGPRIGQPRRRRIH